MLRRSCLASPAALACEEQKRAAAAVAARMYVRTYDTSERRGPTPGQRCKIARFLLFATGRREVPRELAYGAAAVAAAFASSSASASAR